MDEKKYKKKNKPAACTTQPWRKLIPADKREQVLTKIRQETTAAYGYSMDECPKRKVCISKTCIGRPLPWKSATAQPYLEKLKETHDIKNEELFLSDCNTCAIKSICKSTCPQINDWMNRDKNTEPNIIYKENLDNFVETDIDTSLTNLLGKGLSIPWDCLTDLRKDVIRLYLYEQKDFATVASELYLHDQARAKYEFYAGLTKLSEYAVMRKFYNENYENITIIQRLYIYDKYFYQYTLEKISLNWKVSRQTIQQTIASVIKKHNIKWNVYVRKEGNKTIYNVPELMK